METLPMGKVLVAATIENLDDLFQVQKGLLAPEQVRRVEVRDALVETGATGCFLPKKLIAALGLDPVASARRAAWVGRCRWPYIAPSA